MASCASASLQGGKDFLVAAKDRSEKGAVPGQEDGKDGGEGRECNQVHRKRVNTVQFSTTCGGKRQWCPGRSEHISPSYVWENDVKASVHKAWQISPSCRLLDELAFVLDGTQRFHDKPQGWSVLRDAKRVLPSCVR